MTSLRLSLLFLALWTVSLADNGEQQNHDEPQLHTNSTANSQENSSDSGSVLHNEMIQRALYVLIGVTAIGFLYFLVKAVRLKKKTVQRKKYGLLSDYDDTMEMGHLESDEDDNTVYEAKSMRR